MRKRLCWIRSFGFLAFGIPTFAWTYPVKEVEGAFCNQGNERCKIELPRILQADYLKYQKLFPYAQVYTVMWGGTYFWGWDFGFWSHQGVDIASPIWTPIVAVWEGEVVFAGEKGEWWKVVVIKHHWKGHILHSVYAHLEKIEVQVGTQVKEWDRIATMGSTWNSTGPHLHFQIDTHEGDHPFFPKGCWGTISEVVNEARCRNQVKENTLDPILFLETQGEIFLAERKQDPIQTSSFLTPQELSFQLSSSVAKLGKTLSLKIAPKITSDAFLREELILLSDADVEIFPTKIAYLGTGREITLHAKTRWLHQIKVMNWEKQIRVLSFFVLDQERLELLEKKSETSPQLKQLLTTL